MIKDPADHVYRCQMCGATSPRPLALRRDHTPHGAICVRHYLRRNHAVHALRRGDVDGWVKATADLRRIAEWRAQ